MPANDIATLPDGPITTKPAKQKRIPRKVVHAIRLLVSGECKNIKAAAERAGLSREWLSKMLQRSQIQMFVQNETRKTIAAGTMRASARLLELVDASSEHVSLDAAKHVLAVEGIRPPESGHNVNIINNIAPGYVIKLRHVDDAAQPAAQVIDAQAVDISTT
jgi:hypothetical protein